MYFALRMSSETQSEPPKADSATALTNQTESSNRTPNTASVTLKVACLFGAVGSLESKSNSTSRQRNAMVIDRMCGVSLFVCVSLWWRSIIAKRFFPPRLPLSSRGDVRLSRQTACTMGCVCAVMRPGEMCIFFSHNHLYSRTVNQFLLLVIFKLPVTSCFFPFVLNNIFYKASHSHSLTG